MEAAAVEAAAHVHTADAVIAAYSPEAGAPTVAEAPVHVEAAPVEAGAPTTPTTNWR